MALDTIIHDISTLRLLGKDPDLPSDSPDEDNPDLPDDEKFFEESSLNPAAKPFTPSRFSTPVPIASIAQRQLQSKAISSEVSSPPVSSPVSVPAKDEDDIEMGELPEEPGEVKSPKKKVREDLEEGEASDGSSPLSAVPNYE
jgi:THO complex subunit 7